MTKLLHCTFRCIALGHHKRQTAKKRSNKCRLHSETASPRHDVREIFQQCSAHNPPLVGCHYFCHNRPASLISLLLFWISFFSPFFFQNVHCSILKDLQPMLCRNWHHLNWFFINTTHFLCNPFFLLFPWWTSRWLIETPTHAFGTHPIAFIRHL